MDFMHVTWVEVKIRLLVVFLAAHTCILTERNTASSGLWGHVLRVPYKCYFLIRMFHCDDAFTFSIAISWKNTLQASKHIDCLWGVTNVYVIILSQSFYICNWLLFLKFKLQLQLEYLNYFLSIPFYAYFML